MQGQWFQFQLVYWLQSKNIINSVPSYEDRENGEGLRKKPSVLVKSCYIIMMLSWSHPFCCPPRELIQVRWQKTGSVTSSQERVKEGDIHPLDMWKTCGVGYRKCCLQLFVHSQRVVSTSNICLDHHGLKNTKKRHYSVTGSYFYLETLLKQYCMKTAYFSRNDPLCSVCMAPAASRVRFSFCLISSTYIQLMDTGQWRWRTS